MTAVKHGPQPARLVTRTARRLLPRPLLRAWQVRRTARRITGFSPRVVSHSYHGIPLTLRIADPLGARWYDQDWPDSVLPELEFLQESVLRRGSLVFEIGCHQGIVALMMGAIVGQEGLVVAVEPSDHQAGLAVHNVLLNRMPQVVPLRAAVGEAPGDLLFERLGSTVSTGGSAADRVPCVSVDQLAATYGIPDLLWIDVEGFECQVLRGAAVTLSARPACCVEVHGGSLLEQQGGSVAEVLSHLAAGSYELRCNTSPNDRVHGLEAFDPARPPVGRFSLVATWAEAKPSAAPRTAAGSAAGSPRA